MDGRGPGWQLLITGIMLLAAAGCDRVGQSQDTSTAEAPAPKAPAPGTPFVAEQDVMARVNGQPVSASDVEVAIEELKRLVQVYQGRWETLPAEDLPDRLDLMDVANSVIDSELKAQDMKTRGLSTDAKRRWAYLQRSFYAQEWDRWQRDRVMPTQDEIHAFYEQNKAGFIDPERLHIRQIVTDSLGEAEAVRAKAIQGTPFAELAKGFSMGAAREQGGDVGWYVRDVHKRLLTATGKAKDEHTFFEQLEPVAFSLEVGQVSMPVKGPDGKFYIVTVEERRPTSQQAELQVRDTIQEGLALQKLQEQLKQMRDKATIQRFPERLKDVTQ